MIIHFTSRIYIFIYIFNICLYSNRVIDPAPESNHPIIYGLKSVPLVNYSFHILLVCYDDGFVRLWNLDCENDADVIVDCIYLLLLLLL